MTRMNTFRQTKQGTSNHRTNQMKSIRVAVAVASKESIDENNLALFEFDSRMNSKTLILSSSIASGSFALVLVLEDPDEDMLK